ncbi:MAG TPA: signal peptide peptidase SppA [Kofleriaceae bacterium]|nr:signal peptide peptidase SppA [Kofleriaceae bacterium]
MLRARHVCCALVLASCADSSPRDDRTQPAGSGDPWAEASGKQGKAGKKPEGKGSKNESDDGDGFDLRASLAKVAENLTKPGPYEAPEASSDFDAARPHWGVLELGGDIVERQALSLTGGHGTELRALIDRLRDLASERTLTGVVVRTRGIELSVPDAVELRAAVHDLRQAGKRVACHTENASNTAYLVLSACDRIGLAPLGDLLISGPTAMPVHIKPLLDKLGIEADFLHVGAYKGAAEPLTRDAPSREMEETLGAILDRRYQTMVDVIAQERKLAPAAVKALIDTALFSSDQARAANLVDDVGSFEAFRDGVRKQAPWTKLELDPDKRNQLAMMMKLGRFFGAIPPDRPAGGHVAVVYAIGDIVDGPGDGLLGARQQIAARTLVPALRALTLDDAVKAVVVRIDSGGGSAQASELIWRAVAELKAKKPVIVSMSDVAASGGYYIASGATRIFALDDTLTGSIGVVGGKLALRGALGKLGVNTFPMGRGKRATMASSLGPWSDDERSAIRGQMEAVYRVFVGRVAEGRGKPADEVLKIAEGRVWTGARARELGLVDQIGGLDAALAEARRLAKVDAATPLEIYPPAPTLRDLVAGLGQVHAPLGVSTEAAIAAMGALDPGVAAVAEHLLRLVLSFQSSTIQAVAVLPAVR